MAFDFKKEYKEFYLPKEQPALIDVPEMHYLAVRGEGDPNEEDGAYKRAIGLLYGVAFTAGRGRGCRLRKEAGFPLGLRDPSAGLRHEGGV